MNWCKSCELCAARKSPPRKQRAKLQTELSSHPFQRVAMDILGPLLQSVRGSKYILVMGDYFTKWMEAFDIPNMEAVTVAEAFVFQFVSQFGVPDFLHTDQGRNFESALLMAVCTLLGVSKTRTSPYHPQSDGLIERFNRTLLSLLSMATKQDEHNWDLHLLLVMLAYRTSVQESKGALPLNLYLEEKLSYLLMLCMVYPPQTSPIEVDQYALDLRLRMEKAYRQVRERMGLQHQQQKELYNKSSNGDPFKVGDMVWLHCSAVPRGKSPKLHCFWQGPYRINKVVSDVLYNISLRDRPRKHQVVHFDWPKPCVHLPSNLQERQQNPAETILPDGPDNSTLDGTDNGPILRLCLEI